MAMFALAWSLSVACSSGGSDTGSKPGGGDSDDTGTTPAGFENEVELADSKVDSETGTCDIAYYWPVHEKVSPLMVVRLESPEPPYEIRSLAASVFSVATGAFSLDDGTTLDCSGSRSLRLFAFVTEATDMSAYVLADGAWPDIPAIAEVTVTGAGDGEDWVEVELIEGGLDVPVRVEEPGSLWVGYEWLETSEQTAVQCAAGCNRGRLDTFSYMVEGNEWGNETGWSPNNENPDLRATIGY